MKLFHKGKDGGPESKVTGYWLIESKRFISIALLRFDKGSREAFHTHAFHAISWVLKGCLYEQCKDREDDQWMKPSLKPIITPRSRYHRVWGMADVTWAFTIRGPWSKTWKEYIPADDAEIVLSDGRKIVG